MNLPRISADFKIWLNIEIDGVKTPFIGEQKIQLLKEIANSGSINEAAKALGLDYRKAWDMIEAVHEKIEPIELVTTKRGRGGGTELTPFANHVLDLYEKFLDNMDMTVTIPNL